MEAEALNFALVVILCLSIAFIVACLAGALLKHMDRQYPLEPNERLLEELRRHTSKDEPCR